MSGIFFCFVSLCCLMQKNRCSDFLLKPFSFRDFGHSQDCSPLKVFSPVDSNCVGKALFLCLNLLRLVPLSLLTQVGGHLWAGNPLSVAAPIPGAILAMKLWPMTFSACQLQCPIGSCENFLNALPCGPGLRTLCGLGQHWPSPV